MEVDYEDGYGGSGGDHGSNLLTGVSSFPAFDSVPMSSMSAPLIPPLDSSEDDEESEEDQEQAGTGFVKSMEQLEELAGMLVCTNCNQLPVGKVWMLGHCLHKYCPECATKLAGHECVACGVKGFPKDAKPDLFSTSILCQIPSLHVNLKGLQGEGDDDSVSLKDDEMNDQEAEEVSVIENELAVSTPKPASQSQDFPDVFEETPQNKTTTILLATSKDSDLVPRVLMFPSQDSTIKDKEVVVQKVSSPKKDETSDEELFKSQPPPAETVVPTPSEPEAPELTPYAYYVPKPRRPVRQMAGTFSRKHIDTTPYKPLPEDEERPKERSSDEHDPPELTPYKSIVADNKVSPEKQIIVKERKFFRAKHSNKKPKSDNSDAPKSALTTPVPPPVEQKKDDGANSGSRLSRRRRVSASSSVSSEKSCPTSTSKSKPKKNAKGETELHLKCKIGALDKVTALLDSGADVNAKDNADWTPLHEAINGKGSPSQKLQIVILLCEKGADVNALGDRYLTPLHCAASTGNEDLVKTLLQFHASPNIRNQDEQLPKDVTSNLSIIKLLEEKMVNVSIPASPAGNGTNLNNSTFIATSSVVEEDPAVLAVMVKTAVIYFNYPASVEVIAATKKALGLKVSDTLTPKVTHIIHDYIDGDQRAFSRVPLTQPYLFGIAHCMWQVSSDWITASLKNGKVITPTSFEIAGVVNETCSEADSGMDGLDIPIPGLARMNKERGNGGLFTGISFYLYKACNYSFNSLKLTKPQLSDLIKGAGGVPVNREPNPNEDLDMDMYAFHVYNDVRGLQSPSTGEAYAKDFAITKQIILYSTKSPKDIPPQEKRYTFEHIKTLKVEWLVDSLREFRLKSPEEYY